MRPIIRLAQQIAISNVRELRLPYKFTFALTYRCQFRCSMCGIWEKQPADELDAGEISDFFGKAGCFSWINLTGGEIFLRKDLMEIIRGIVRSSSDVYLINFPTNGYQTDIIAETVREILGTMRIPRLAVTVSLDGPPELHDRIRNVPGSWERAVETGRRLRKLKSRSFDVYFGMTLQDANSGAYEDTVHAVRSVIGDIRHRDFHVNVMHSSSHYYSNETCGAVRDKRRIIEDLVSVRRTRKGVGLSPVSFLESMYQRSAADYLISGKTPIPCQALSVSMFMDPGGTVYPCTIFDRPVGNIRAFGYDLSRLWNSGKRLSARRDIIEKNCPQCWTPCEAYQSILANLFPSVRR